MDSNIVSVLMVICISVVMSALILRDGMQYLAKGLMYYADCRIGKRNINEIYVDGGKK